MDQYLASEGTPIARNERSTYFHRSFTQNQNDSTLGTPVGNIKSISITPSNFSSPMPRHLLGTHMDNNNMKAITSASFNSTFETPLLMDITEDASVSFFVGDLDPSAQASGLYQEFLDLYQNYAGEHEIFDLLLQYEEACSCKAKQLLNILNKAPPVQNKQSNGMEVLEALRNERNTWRLIRILYNDRISMENINEENMFLEPMGERLSDKQIIQNLYLKNSAVRHCQLVVDWLEKNAAEDSMDINLDKLEYFADHSFAWENTLHFLKANRTTLERPTRDSLITELDPDAPTRQRSSILHASDKEDEIRLLKFMFINLRAGNLEEAQRLTENFGQPWLAASLEGWRLFHDPNYETETLVEGDNLLPTEGNKYRDIWKISCWRMAKESRISVFQQALYGVLSGNLKAILPVCMSWSDYLWAYAKVYVDQQMEQELRAFTQCEYPLEELPADYWDKMLDFEQIFQELNACTLSEVRKEGQGPYQIIQKYLILNDVDGLIEVMYSWTRQVPRPSGQLLRIIAHIVLFLRVIDNFSKEELCVAILEAYVQELIDQRKIPLVAYYAATLPPAYQVVWYAKFLEDILDNSERQMCLKYAEEASLDIPQITKMVVERTRTKVVEKPMSESIVTSSTTDDDQQKINSIDWLVFDPTLRAEAMKQANALMRTFVENEKLDAARHTFAKIPSDSISVIMRQTKLAGHSELKADDDNAFREYLCFKAYLEAFDSFNDWFHHFQHGKPRCPEAPNSNNLKFKDKIAYEHELKQYNLEMERWETTVISQTKTTKDRLYNVLLFVNGGWMVDQRTDAEMEEGRQKQLHLLRKLCIPQITKLLHNVLHNAQLYKESVQLADIIASEQHQLYKEFTVQELKQLLSSLKESSLVLLSQNLDPLGYPFEQSSESL